MPGPMGGGRGGGFSGGSRGGGSHGGGFHGGGPRGPMHHGPRHHHGPMFFGPRFHAPRRHHGGGGCLGSIIGSIIAIPLLLIFFVMMALSMCTGGFTLVEYDEERFQQYADDQYYVAFADSENYEGNILLVLLTYEDGENYDCIAWGGYDIDSDTEELFGSYLQSTVRNKIPDYYQNALTKSLRDIVNAMADAAPENAAGATDTSHSKLVNNTSLQIDKNTVNTALQSFTEKTGYPIAIVVEDAEEVFGADIGGGEGGNITALIFAVAVVVIVVILVATKSNKRNGGNDSSDSKTDKTNPDAGQGKYDPNTGTWK